MAKQDVKYNATKGGKEGLRSMDHAGYSGVDNLEVLALAENYNRFLDRAVLAAAAAAGAGRVLDFGAGTGRFAAPLRDRGFDVVCVEPDPHLRAGLAAQGLTAVAEASDIPPASLDLVYSLNVLEHIADDGGALRQLAERLRPGGRLFLYVPAFAVLFTAMDHKVGHLRRYRRAGLVRLCQDSGFAVERAVYVDSLGFAATLAYRLFGNRRGDIDPVALRLYDRLIFPFSRGLDRILGRVLGKNLLLEAVRR